MKKAFFLFVTFGLVGLMCGSASGQQAKNIIKLKSAITVKDASYLNAKVFFLRRGELRLLIEDDPKVLRVPQMFLAYINPKINVVKNFYEVAFNRLILHLPKKKILISRISIGGERFKISG